MNKLQGVYIGINGVQGVKLNNGTWRTYDTLEAVLKDFKWSQVKNKIYYSV